MADASSPSAAIRFLDREAVVADLRRAAAGARRAHPEIDRVLLVGSLARGDWTADSDADLIVVVRREFHDLIERAPYQIFTPAIPTDTVVCSHSEFERLAHDPASVLGQDLRYAVEL